MQRVIEDRPPAHLRHVAEEVRGVAAVVGAELVVGRLDPSAVRHVQPQLKVHELLRRILGHARPEVRRVARHGVLRERAC